MHNFIIKSKCNGLAVPKAGVADPGSFIMVRIRPARKTGSGSNLQEEKKADPDPTFEKKKPDPDPNLILT